ncbi:hypothetical protein ACFPIJ_59865 [Dactylosporangium cerinum]|uniref:Uncharacterized protein n=1 Tax=Dactylosporangium cerinum TaxID=1434730 RepID=A0ABV9WGK4_9ACTN
MNLFPLHDGNRSVPAAPGARKATAAVPFPDLDEPLLIPAAGLAVLPEALRHNETRGGRTFRLFAAGVWINGVNGYAFSPSQWRPALSVWAYSEGGLLVEGEWGTVEDWLAEHLPHAAPDPDLWARIAADLRPPQPAPSWDLSTADGAVVFPAEEYEHGGWEGGFAAGFAHGPFRFTDDSGAPTQEGAYEHGWPSGRWTVHPLRGSGRLAAATVDYAAGVPVAWTIPPLAFDTVPLRRSSGPAEPLASLAAGHAGVVLVDCASTGTFELSPQAAADWSGDVLVVGVHPSVPGTATLGGHEIEVLVGPELTASYGGPFPVLYLTAEGRFAGSSRLASIRFGSRFGG